MTAPKINTIHRGGSRYYVHPDTGAKVPGVTSVLNMLPKSFLKFWASKVVATYAVDNLPSLVGLALNGDRQGAIDYLKRSPDRDTAQAADTGSKAHEAFEYMLKNGKRPVGIHPDVMPFIVMFEKFIEDQQPAVTLQEETVYSEEHDYMGSFDGYGSLKLSEGRPVWFDWKTTRSGIHAEVALQLAAYRHSRWIIRPDGSTMDTPPAEGGLVVHVRPEGLQVVEVDCDREVFEFFLNLRKTFRWVDGKEREVISAPAYRITTDDLVVAAAPRRRRRAAE